MSRSLLSVLLSLCVALVAASDVIELGVDSFASGIADKDIILVEFYAPWYEPCFINYNQKLLANDTANQICPCTCIEL